MSARIGKPLAVLLFLSLAATLVGAFKFSPCEQSLWATPDQYVHACYSDIATLYGERDLDKDQWSYTSKTNAVEYPVLTGTVMWIFAKVLPSGDNEILNTIDSTRSSWPHSSSLSHLSFIEFAQSSLI